MSIRVINGLDDLKSLVGQTLGHSDWLEITQERVRKFAEATDDFQWIHCDPERAKRELPFGGTVAHGFLTLSLTMHMSTQICAIEGVRMVMNYGLNRVRFPRAVLVGSRIRMSSEVAEVKETRLGTLLTLRQTIVAEGDERPVCVAESLSRLFF